MLLPIGRIPETFCDKTPEAEVALNRLVELMVHALNRTTEGSDSQTFSRCALPLALRSIRTDCLTVVVGLPAQGGGEEDTVAGKGDAAAYFQANRRDHFEPGPRQGGPGELAAAGCLHEECLRHAGQLQVRLSRNASRLAS